MSWQAVSDATYYKVFKHSIENTPVYSGYNPTITLTGLTENTQLFVVACNDITCSNSSFILAIPKLDSDEDGLENSIEIEMGTDPYNPDSDGDGVNDLQDQYPLNPMRFSGADTNKNGVPDDIENSLGFNGDPNSVWLDEDGDRMPAVIERLEGLNESVKDNDLVSESRLLVYQAIYDTQLRLSDEDAYFKWRVNQLNAKVTSASDIYAQLFNVKQQDYISFVQRVHNGMLLRDATLVGLRTNWRNLNQGVTKKQLVERFMNSQEYLNIYGTNVDNDFVKKVYVNLLGKSPSFEEENNLVFKLMERVISRSQIMLAVLESSEYKNRVGSSPLIKGLYMHLFETKPALNEQVLLESLFSQNTRDMFRYILANDEYHRPNLVTPFDVSADTDADQRPDGIEFADGYNYLVKDNDVTNDDALFIRQMYRDLVSELWSEELLTQEILELVATSSRGAWAASLLQNEEYISTQTPVTRLYESAFLRMPNYSGWQYWQGRFEDGVSITTIANRFAQSSEFISRYGMLSDEEYVDLIFHNVLGRTATESGKNYWVSRLESGTSRGVMLAAFSNSEEKVRLSKNKVNASVLYHTLLMRSGTQSELNGRESELMQGDAATAIEFLINDNDYAVRFH
ncbi:DUF4214 domain-containing protein [Pseudoalteromonas sp. GB56]